MVITSGSSMRAIRASIFFAGTVLFGCSPSLERSAGSLELLWFGVDEGADQLRATVSQGEVSYTVEADPNQVTRLSLESVPSGTITVLGESLGAGVPLQSRVLTGQIQPDTVTSLAIDLGSDGGQVESVETGWILAPFHFVRGEAQAPFIVAADFESAFQSSLVGARTQLGTLSAISVTGVRLALLPASQEQELDKVWRGAISIGLRDQLDDSAGTIVAEGTPGDGSAALMPTLTGAELSALFNVLIEDRAEVTISGIADSGGSAPNIDAQVSFKFLLE